MVLPRACSSSISTTSNSIDPVRHSLYLGRFQIRGVIGHSTRQCSCLSTSTLAFSISHPCSSSHPIFIVPYANNTVHYSAPCHPLDWVVDSGASHHVTTNFVSLALHESYTALNNVIICDGSGLSIAHIGSFSFTSLPTTLLFNNLLHVLAMSKNLISVSTLYADNPINFLFFDSFFQV